MAAQQAALGVAKKGLGMMFNASKVAAAAISAGVQKARKGYANKHETGVLNELKAKGLAPVEHLMEALKRFYYLMMAGYKHELQAAANLSAKRLVDPEKSTVPLNVVTVLGGVVCEESLKYGEFQKNQLVQGMQDFMNKQRMGKDHYDRDSMAHDVYYAVLICAEEFEAEWDQMENCFREAVTRTIEWAAAGVDNSPDARTKAAKSMYYVGQAVKNFGQQSEERRQKNIKDAESMLRIEQQRRRSTGPSFHSDGAGPPSYNDNRLPVTSVPSSYQNNTYSISSAYQGNPYTANLVPISNQNNSDVGHPPPPSYQDYPYIAHSVPPSIQTP